MTDFLGDPTQFEFLVQRVLPELIKTYGYGIRKKLVLWSVSCSNGEEPYSLAMALSEFSDRYPGFAFDFLILATDAEPGALQTAERAIYHEESIHPVPLAWRKKYLLRSKDREKKRVKIADELRKLVKFRHIDFMKPKLEFREPIDVIFCRGLFDRLEKHLQEKL
ncbi:MAG: chemotaxis protein CheR, partial [Deltaproteobacteria bacterium]|nr:chemotaxis protein CheR [Deltaproteobacteria bacterium]